MKTLLFVSTQNPSGYISEKSTTFIKFLKPQIQEIQQQIGANKFIKFIKV